MPFKTFFIVTFFSLTVFSQQNNAPEVLFTVNKKPVYEDEFLRVYNKNSDVVSEENRLSKREYLDLFINYKLKLQQAYDLGYDTLSNITDELAGYREQLIQPYLYDNIVVDSLVAEAYARKKYELNASHILIKLLPNAPPADTLAAYKKALAVRADIVNGNPFEEVAKKVSDDPSVLQNGGNLGYFSVFDMVYPFENAAYNTAVGQVSAPFRTSFGYHLVKVNDKRPSKGEISVAHIMLNKTENDSISIEKQINDIYKQLKNGGDFKFMAIRHSQDRASAANGGKLPKFSSNKMIQPFSDIAFGLKNEHDISKPFKTKYGWHIVKLLKKHPVGDFKAMEKELKAAVKKSDRFGLSGKSIADKLKEQYKITVDKKLYNQFLIQDSISLKKHKKQPVFILEDKPVNVNKLLAYAATRPNDLPAKIFEDFKNHQVLNYYKNNLEKTDKNFAYTMQEYKDGLMLFALLQDKIWKKAENDTVALKQYYQKHINNYYYQKRAEVVIANCTEEKYAKAVQKYLKKNWDIQKIKAKINDGAVVNVIFTKGVLEAQHAKLPKAYKIATIGVSDIFKEGKHSFTVVRTHKIIAPEPVPFKKIRGKVSTDYQQHLEKKWIEDLKQTYPITVNKEVLEKLTIEN